jgi:NAD(P)-dependent dehydrogenase (short-subunit alcohol dehydrogenase family)
LRVNRAFLPAMREKKSGLVVFVSSVVGRFVVPFGGVYVASKWALEALAETLSYELAPFNIDVAIVEPGAYPTEIFGKTFGADDSAVVASYGDVAKISDQVSAGLGAAAEGRNPQDVADAILSIAKAPAGARPLRTSVPPDPAVEAINAATAPIQREVLTAFGLEALLPKVVA